MRGAISHICLSRHTPQCWLTDMAALVCWPQRWEEKRARVVLWGRHIPASPSILTRRPPSCGIPSAAHPLQHHGWKQCGVPLWRNRAERLGELKEVMGWRTATAGASPPVGVRGSSIVKGGTAFTVSLIDASPGRHQCHCALVATIGSCIVQWGPGEYVIEQMKEADMNTTDVQ